MDHAVPGLRIGHADAGHTGCTVFLGPFRGAVLPLGFALGSRELPTLEATHLVDTVDALLLAGGGAFGLAAAEGVVAWLEEQGLGFDAGVARVPIVPAAVIFDLRAGAARVRPDAALARRACAAAREGTPQEGRVGVGTGATVGKLLGVAGAARGGFGYAAAPCAEFVLAACVVVNAFGDVLDGSGDILAGARRPDGSFADSAATLRQGSGPDAFAAALAGASTTVGVVATDAPVSRAGLLRVARAAAAGMARRISPVFTPFDGDAVFALSTAPQEPPSDELGRILSLAALADHLLGLAIGRAVALGSEVDPEAPAEV
jgi:L-aminopeptidase/D-esterase-like protein